MIKERLLLVSDSSRAKLWKLKGATEWTPKQVFDHPDSRAKGTDLKSSAQGRKSEGAGSVSSTSMQSHHEIHQVEEEKFAAALALALDHEAGQNQVESVVLVAPPEFLGILRKKLSKRVEQLVTQTFHKNLIQHPDHEMHAEIIKLMGPVNLVT